MGLKARDPLSPGWTHTGTPVLGYTAGMVREMLDLCGECPRVTFAASAAHLFASAHGPRTALLQQVITVAAPAAAIPAAADDAERSCSPPDSPAANSICRIRSLTLWGPAPRAVRSWMSALDGATTFVDVKECTALEAAVITLYAALRPFYAFLA